jgi:hypothetical protein
LNYSDDYRIQSTLASGTDVTFWINIELFDDVDTLSRKRIIPGIPIVGGLKASEYFADIKVIFNFRRKNCVNAMSKFT